MEAAAEVTVVVVTAAEEEVVMAEEEKVAVGKVVADLEAEQSTLVGKECRPRS